MELYLELFESFKCLNRLPRNLCSSSLNPKLEIYVIPRWFDCLCTYVVVEQIHLRYKYIFTDVHPTDTHIHGVLFVFIFFL